MSDSTFYVGEVATLSLRFVNAANALADPSAITLTITDPSGTVTTYPTNALTHVSTGYYTFNLTLTAPGTWTYEADGSGVLSADAVGYLTATLTAGAALHGGPCADWCSVDDIRLLGAYQNTTTLPDPLLIQMIPVASKLLFERTARRFTGICPATIRPMRRSVWLDHFGGVWPGQWASWSGLGWWPGSSSSSEHTYRTLGNGTVPEIQLGYYPVRQIVEVRIDGQVLSPTTYRLDDHRWLVRLDGSMWPVSQDMTKDPTTDTNTFQVKLLHGTDPGPDGRLAAAVLAGELALANTNQASCRLPKRVTQITRQNSTIALLDPLTLFKDGLFGIPEVDLYVQAQNPDGLRRRATVSGPWPSSNVRRAGY